VLACLYIVRKNPDVVLQMVNDPAGLSPNYKGLHLCDLTNQRLVVHLVTQHVYKYIYMFNIAKLVATQLAAGYLGLTWMDTVQPHPCISMN
jgi:hypothetical protein